MILAVVGLRRMKYKILSDFGCLRFSCGGEYCKHVRPTNQTESFLNAKRVYRGLLIIWSFFKGNGISFPMKRNTFHPSPCIHRVPHYYANYTLLRSVSIIFKSSTVRV